VYSDPPNSNILAEERLKKGAFRLSNFGTLEFEIGGNPLVRHLPELNPFAVGIEEYGQISVTQMQ
jgi:hypothetical protein